MTNPWLYQDDSYHVPYSYNRMEYTPGLLESFIDPMLQSFTTPSAYPTTMDQHHSMQFQLKEGQKTMVFNSDIPQPATFIPSTLGVMNPFQVRCISPNSAFETSEASGSAQSPPADTNTEPPANYEARSPLQEPLHPEDFGLSQNHSIQFAGIGKGLGNGFFVNPMDVNSTGQMDGYDSETSTLEFTLPQRVNSWESYTTGGVSGCDMEQIQQQQQQQQQHNSPIVDYTKPVNHYPPASQEKIEEPSLVILPRAPNLKRTRQADADADEYLPATKRTAAVLSRSTSTKTKTTTPRRGRPPTSHFPLTTHRPHQHQPTRTLPSTATKALTPNSSRGNLLCPHPPCHQSSHGFKDQPSLDAHIKKQHSRPFICVFSFAGCDSTFGSKNEWKRHVASQHLVLEYWLCQEGECANVDNNIPSSVAAISGGSGSRSGKRRKPVQTMIPGNDNDENEDDEDLPLLPNGAIFNRKDLYTQHVRRMHLPSHLTPFLRKESSPAGSNKSSSSSSSSALTQTNETTQQELNIYIATLQSRAQIKRCALPTYMRCPVPSCPQPPFKGTEAWDQRMEHVAKHLESYAAATAATVAAATASGTRTGSEVEVDSRSSVAEQDNNKVEFGSESDTTLTEWAASREVGIIKRVIRTGSTGTGTGKAEGGGWKWVTRDPIKRRGHGGNGTGSGSGSGSAAGGYGGVGRGKGGRTKVVKTKGKAKAVTTKANMKREQEVEEEIVVQTRTQNHQSFEFEDDE
ncbi:hypothetical protein NEUTE1DRAFT_77420 [Neurospora tetrasperma FGSC 2508]|uniref:C2H2-type domain-containing protein n=1 Tax=Neurospora tetrasperma (strain FGSC 2508 / ATCC MYA-4615 / P0657) TaxID=510951 RepID=F8MD72_NEUT8|nr:uncharacterized protein NEUTE1DRAFT_77420 [Neurospora tetrasperma FGSC 2508]EGO61417.1 hypothetical protein NEUTE1DRAFT_77420 [Neurospora tetrasperma FGSC 2508]EGZ74555.1 hypothetical protein NEUTE2DRAFT_103386 [Neurospora tetrasperma FGSC 2509]